MVVAVTRHYEDVSALRYWQIFRPLQDMLSICRDIICYSSTGASYYQGCSMNDSIEQRATRQLWVASSVIVLCFRNFTSDLASVIGCRYDWHARPANLRSNSRGTYTDRGDPEVSRISTTSMGTPIFDMVNVIRGPKGTFCCISSFLKSYK